MKPDIASITTLSPGLAERPEGVGGVPAGWLIRSPDLRQFGTDQRRCAIASPGAIIGIPTLRIPRVACPAHVSCRASAHPEDSAIVVTGHDFRWEAAGALPLTNPSGMAWEQVRVEIVAPASH